MSRPISHLVPPDIPAGASPQFGSGNQAGMTPGAGHPTSMASLKSLLQSPSNCDQRSKDCRDMKEKEEPEEMSSSMDGGDHGRSLKAPSQSAFLGPLLWERTLPCDGSLFQLQYMDLEEFLTENGMGSLHHGSSSSAQIPSQSSQSTIPSQSSQCPPSPPPPCSSSSSISSPISSSPSSPSLLPLNVQQAGPSLRAECLHGGQAGSLDSSPAQSSSSSSSCPPHPLPACSDGNEIIVNFDPDPADLALSSIPGQEAFDPRRRHFTEEELRPQPIIKKAQKMLVPDEMKDEKYWNRRCKNNDAAKRSRDARRLKENQISVRAAFLERENATLRREVADMRKELSRCRDILSKYQSRHGDH
ncbi:D site albumin promoter binding protein b [Paramormyrops kingsleyae]|uniref:D site albumin promoter binding protein b n=1 Tax=Paramormyrops kingsleyae TaxID=1676925 RepID=UPI003B976E8D